MAIWGKLFGGISGFAMGGPLGGLVGLTLGHLSDKKELLTPRLGTWGTNFDATGKRDPYGMSFFTAAKLSSIMGKKDELYALGVIMLCAKLAKCDGFVNKAEIQAFRRAYQFPPENLKQIGKVFDHARQRIDDFEAYALELGKAFQNDKAPLEILLSALFYIARADITPHAPLHPKEIDFLKKTYKAFQLSEHAWERAEKGQPHTPSQKIEEAYQILGTHPQASNDDIRKRWRALMKRYHPDIIAQKTQTPQEQKKMQEHISKINAAWDHIKKERGL